MVPMKKELINKVLMEFHTSPVSGHAGVKRTGPEFVANFIGQELLMIPGLLSIIVKPVKEESL